MDEMEKLKDEILRFCQGKFEVFYSLHPISLADRITQWWVGNDYESFLSVAGAIGIKVVYFFEGQVHNEDPAHSGERYNIQLGFLHNSVFHIFERTADWFTREYLAPGELEDREEERFIKEIADKTADELRNEVIEFIREEHDNLPSNKTELEACLGAAQKQFWSTKGLALVKDPRVKIRVQLKLNEVSRNVVDHFLREQEQEKLKVILDRPTSETVREMIEMINDRHSDVLDDAQQFSSRFYVIAKREFWLDRGLEHVSDPRARLKINKIEDQVKNHFWELIRENKRKKEEGLFLSSEKVPI